MELYELIKDVAESIQQDLKEKASIYMVEYADQILMNPDILNTSKTDDDEYFNLYIKIGNETICHRVWDAKIYPPKTRYTVDVRPHLKKLLRDLTDIFSSEDLIYEYLNYKLV